MNIQTEEENEGEECYVKVIGTIQEPLGEHLCH